MLEWFTQLHNLYWGDTSGSNVDLDLGGNMNVSSHWSIEMSKSIVDK